LIDPAFPAYVFTIVLLVTGINYAMGLFFRWFWPTKKMQKAARGIMLDSLQAVWVFTILSTPVAILRLISFLGFGDMDVAYTSFFQWLGISGGSLTLNPSLMTTIFSTIESLVFLIIAMFAFQTALTITFGIMSAIFGEGAGIIASLLGGVGVFLVGLLGIAFTYWILGLAPILVLTPMVLLVLIGAYYLAEFVSKYWAVVMAFGALFYTLPLGFGRKWGATLMATALVLFIGLPLMPVFVNTLGNPTNAMQAAERSQQWNPDVQTYLKQIKPADAFFSVSTLGPLYSDYFRLQVKQVYGQHLNAVWTIWTDQNGWASYPLPTGEYVIDNAYYLEIPVEFTVSANTCIQTSIVNNNCFSVKEGTAQTGYMNLPEQQANVYVQLQIYAFTLQTVKIDVTNPQANLIQTAPFFFDTLRTTGGYVSVPPHTTALNTMNITVCPTADTTNIMLYIPNPGWLPESIGQGTYAHATLEQEPVTLEKTNVCGTLPGAGYGSGCEFKITQEKKMSRCKVLSITATQIAGFSNYPRNNADPTGYNPPPMTQEQQMALVWNLDTLLYFFASCLFIPLIYLTVILPAVAVGIARMILIRWGGD